MKNYKVQYFVFGSPSTKRIKSFSDWNDAMNYKDLLQRTGQATGYKPISIFRNGRKI